MNLKNIYISRRSLVAGLSGIAAASALSACGAGDAASGSAAGSAAAEETVTLTVGASPSPHAVILEDYAAPLLAEQGIQLEVE